MLQISEHKQRQINGSEHKLKGSYLKSKTEDLKTCSEDRSGLLSEEQPER